MKNLLFLILVHGCHLSRAENWMPISEIKTGNAKTVYMNQSDCEKISPCVDVTGKDVATHDVVIENVDDTTRPIYAAKSDIWICDGETDCYNKLAVKTCPSEKFVNAEFTEVYCTSVVGYEQKEVEVLQENPTKVAAKLADIQKGAQVAELQATGDRKRKIGSSLISMCVGYLDSKNLTLEQSVALMTSLKPIIDFASVGRVDLAKIQIQAYVPDATFTQEFKDLLLWEINRQGF